MLKNLNQLVDYLEEHLLEELSLKDLSLKMGISDYHLKRTFSFIAGVSIAEYVKNRKLSLANVDLLQGMPVTEVAFKYGYQSLDGFSRAFREWSGYLPSEIKKLNFQKTFPKLTFYINVKGGISMELKLENKEQFNIIGVAKKVPIQFEGVNQSIIELAQSITPEQRAEMHEVGDLYPNQVVNVSYNFDETRMEETGELTHMIGFLSTQENPYTDLEQLTVPAHTWAIFPNKGLFPQTLQETMARIFSEWLPSSGYELVEAPEISFTEYSEKQEEVYSEVWIAVKKSV
ncbi:AraC family transcriptional regulator [Enterococcus sp. JM4C]|uniref:AraC family transcriptional regulator n=1 Tax=Candidatus Enterococcus huntleyi TaxID=1857217 RepID=UPI00137A4235|nr:GyrI-like domain-containing protein [Enterococcus sp. JM4C]KAF1297486.1 AraC family transcriptional regulator [Enterococcus sp. JM4C]